MEGVRSQSAGFTIMEMMVVVAIIALLIAASSLTLRNILHSDLRSASRRASAAMRFAFDRATMTGRTLRLVFDLKKREIWVEESEDKVTLRSGKEQHVAGNEEEVTKSPERKPASRMLPLFGPPPGGSGEEGAEGEPLGIDAKALTEEWEADKEPSARPKARFQPLKSLVAKKIKLAKRVSIASVMTARMTEPADSGVAHIYFFPQGHCEQAVVHFVDTSEKYYSVVLHPLTGQAKVYSCYYRIPADFGESDEELSRLARQDLCEEGP